MIAGDSVGARKPFVKICGITTPGDALMAVEAGAHAIGLVFWTGSPRAVTPAGARAIREAIAGRAAVVGVFVDAPVEEICAAVGGVPLDVVQLHGDETPSVLAMLGGVPVIKAFDAGTMAQAGDWPLSVVALVDAHDPVKRGGTGRRAPWDEARALAARRAVVLAGGLEARNLAEAVAAVTPLGVDVSSGVESVPGRKDRNRLDALFAAWRALPGAEARWPFGPAWRERTPGSQEE